MSYFSFKKKSLEKTEAPHLRKKTFCLFVMHKQNTLLFSTFQLAG